MGFRVSCIVDAIHYLEGDGTTSGLHGGNLNIASGIRIHASRPEVEALEIFVDPSVLTQPAKLQEIAHHLLPPERRGKGFLSFLNLQALPEVFADGQERILWSIDVRRASRERMVRDRFAQGPLPICWDTHSLGTFIFYWDITTAAWFDYVPSDRVMAMSEVVRVGLDRMFAQVRPDLGKFLCPSEVVIHPYDSSKFVPPDEDLKRRLRLTFGLPKDKVIALYVGRVTAYNKGDLYPLLESFASSRSEDSHLVIVGPETPPGASAALAARARQLGLGDSVSVLGPVEPALRHLIFACGDFFVFPGDSTIETLGNTVHEAMATGLPVIASDWDGFRELIVDGETGYRIPCAWMGGQERLEQMAVVSDIMTNYLLQAQAIHIDMEAFTEKMALLFRDQGLREKLGFAARERAENNYSREVVLKKLYDMWSRQLEEAREEPAEAREARRRRAEEWPLRYSMTDFLSHYATRSVQPDDLIRITPKGAKVKRGQEKLGFHDDTLTFVSGPAMEQILHACSQGPASHGELVEMLTKKFGARKDQAELQIALLLKHGALSMKVN